MSIAYLLLGSNIGERHKNLALAIANIEQKAGIIQQTSSIYETAPWGITDQPFFLNQSVRIKTNLSPMDLLHTLQAIEKKMGRTHTKKWSSRLIDIDIIFYNRQIIQSDELIIPHPYFHLRRFALVPVIEIVSNHFIHPLLNVSCKELLENCEDEGEVRKYFTHPLPSASPSLRSREGD